MNDYLLLLVVILQAAIVVLLIWQPRAERAGDLRDELNELGKKVDGIPRLTEGDRILEGLEEIQRLAREESTVDQKVLDQIQRLAARPPDRGTGYVVSLLSEYVESTQPLYIQIVSKVMNGLAQEHVRKPGIRLIDHAEQRVKSESIDIKNVDPTYDFMRFMAKKLDGKYAYVATSKLGDYDSIFHNSFRDFATTLATKVKSRAVIGCRLYFCETPPNETQMAEMQTMCSIGFAVRYLVVDSTRFSDLKDLGFVLAPRPGRTDITAPLSANNDLVSTLLETHDIECGIEFSLQTLGLSEDKKRKVQYVQNVKIFGGDKAQDLLTDGFGTEWARRDHGEVAQVVHPIDRFDAFLSYRSDHRARVDEIRRNLEQQGLRCWMDDHDAQVGTSFEKQLEDLRPKIRCIVLVIGSDGLSKWQRTELQEFEQSKFIPVLLDERSAAHKPADFEDATFVELFGETSNVNRQLDRLADAIREVPQSPQNGPNDSGSAQEARVGDSS